jgi:ribosomal protein S18 acetylase RimI-like enzyme
VDDLAILQAFSVQTYKDTFDESNTEENMKAYLDEAYAADKLQGEILNTNSMFFFLYSSGELCGYIKVNENDAQTEIKETGAIELERIYVSKDHQGQGIGNTLLNKAIEIAREKDKDYIWLGVWEHNLRALSFYKKHGFYRIGQHAFFMGDDEQVDYLMRKDLK